MIEAPGNFSTSLFFAKMVDAPETFSYITQVCTDFDVCIKLTVFEQFRPPDYENDFGFALSRLVFSQIVFSRN
jgi:hypothetical protein